MAPTFHDGRDIGTELHGLPLRTITQALSTIQALKRTDRRSRAALFHTISLLSVESQNTLRQDLTPESVLDPDGSHNGRRQRRRITGPVSEHTLPESLNVPPTLIDNVPTAPDLSPGVRTLIDGPFLTAPDDPLVQNCISQFIDRTNNQSLAQEICVVCAREQWASQCSLHDLKNIPNHHRLHPQQSHPAHVLLDGMLLHNSAIQSGNQGMVCNDCDRQLRQDKQPMLALSNGLWIGDVPFELAILTLPERLLIARHFPATYIVKLYPKVEGAQYWDKKLMNSGLKGNVSTFKLNTSAIADIVVPV